ncbi:ParB/RepB/Spo0J family partition protein [Streptacidiphilus sp. EB129]|uniref:ParB/RepB/Spo0J family partition protein n=1 Tax=Streptacidiphilus sp. EB129 TaxID=3156262 RepID=UPI003518CD1A
MSVADRVGQGTSFGRAKNARLSDRGRAKKLAEGAIPEYELQRFPLDRVCPSPLNPRRNFGSPEQLSAFGEELRKRQLAACVGVSRERYLEHFPEHDSQITETAEIVLLNGERRLRAALQVGLETLDFVVRDDLAASRSEFIDNLLKENLDREDFDLIERARGVQQLVAECRDQVEAATRLRRDKSWVSNQLILLTLPEETQLLLSTGEMPERHGRVLARQLKREPGLTHPDLVARWEATKTQEEQEKQERKTLLREAAERQRGLSMDNPRATVAAPAAPAADVLRLSMDNRSGAETAPDALAEVPQLSMDNSQAPSSSEVASSPTPFGGAPRNDAQPSKPVELSMDNATPNGLGTPVIAVPALSTTSPRPALGGVTPQGGSAVPAQQHAGTRTEPAERHLQPAEDLTAENVQEWLAVAEPQDTARVLIEALPLHRLFELLNLLNQVAAELRISEGAD